ncbi:MAG: GGDEF domain-containing protein [Rhodocyclaceae bacterium]|nr:GGDEF domain-containing protein [Rhodocyclaceae bacterium]
MRDEPIDIAQSFNQLLDMVDSLNIKASTDALTGALNRHGFHELAGGELQRALRYHRKLSMIIADVDHFKRINDSHGHAVGDRVLIELACLIRDNMRGTDIFARWGARNSSSWRRKPRPRKSPGSPKSCACCSRHSTRRTCRSSP